MYSIGSLVSLLPSLLLVQLEVDVVLADVPGHNSRLNPRLPGGTGDVAVIDPSHCKIESFLLYLSNNCPFVRWEVKLKNLMK